MKQSIELKQNNIEKESISFADIEFGEDNIPQKFVCMSSHDEKNHFIASYPNSSGLKFHMNILMHFVDKFKDKYKVTHNDGGTLIKSGNTITACGTSTQLKNFDRQIAKNVLEKNFPNMEIIIE